MWCIRASSPVQRTLCLASLFYNMNQTERKRKSVLKDEERETKRTHDDVLMINECVIPLKDAGWCSLGRAAQQQERRCVQMHCGRGEELKLQQSESRWEKQISLINELFVKKSLDMLPRFYSQLVCLSFSQVRLLSRTFLKTWGILTWEWLSLQTHLTASWYAVPTLINKIFNLATWACGLCLVAWRDVVRPVCVCLTEL